MCPDPRSISVVICTWNRAESLRTTLQSLASVEIPEHTQVEVLVVDNNSTDHTRRVVDDFAAFGPAISLRYIFEPRQGKQFALNRGIANAAGELLAFTDDDVCFDREWIRAILLSCSEGRVDVVGGVTSAVTSRPLPEWYSTSMSAVLAISDLGSAILDAPPDDYAPAGTNLVAVRRVFESAGGFSERHYRHMDYEFGVRVRRLGFRVRYDPRLIVSTRVHPATLEKRYFRRWYFKQGIAASFDDRSGAPALLLVPRWMWRQLLEEACGWLTDVATGRHAMAFRHETQMAQLLGVIASRWSLKLRPTSHARWTARWSQKTGERFA